MEQKSLPKQTLGRLPKYLSYLRAQPHGEEDFISSTTIAHDLGIGEVQVRKDLHAASGDGRPRIGYQTSQLIERIEKNVSATIYSCAIGYSYSPEGGKPLEEMLKESDEMMYARKAQHYLETGKERR